MKDSVLVFSGVLFRYSAYGAVATFLFSAGATIETQPGNALFVIKIFCLVWGVLMFFGMVAWALSESDKQADQHERRMREWDAQIALYAPKPEPVQVVEPPVLTRVQFMRHVEEFAKRCEIVGHTRSQWLKADGASSSYVFACDGETLTRAEYEEILALLQLRGRRQGRAGESPAEISASQ